MLEQKYYTKIILKKIHGIIQKVTGSVQSSLIAHVCSRMLAGSEGQEPKKASISGFLYGISLGFWLDLLSIQAA